MSQINKLLWTFGVISCIVVLYYFSPLLAVIVVLLSALCYLYFDYERQQGRAVLVHAETFTRHFKITRSWFLNKFINKQKLSDSISTHGLSRSMPSRNNYPANSTYNSMSNSHYDQNSNLNINENSIRRRAGVGNFHRISSPSDTFQAMSPISREPNTSNNFRNLSISDARNTTLPNGRNHSGYLSPILHDSSLQKPSTPGSSSRNVQALGGPLLASTRYNLSSESALFADVNSPGLSSRIARLSEDVRIGSQPATHQSRYAGPGQFPTVHLGPTSRLPVMSLRSTQKTSRAAVRLRMSPRPLASDTLIASNRCRALSDPPLEQPARSVLDTLHELSRKRLHAQLGEPPEDIVKKQRTQRETETTKRGREDSPEHEQKKKRACGNEITSSLSSSRHIVVERAAKRKTSCEDIGDSLSASSAGKIAKKSESSVPQTLPTPDNGDHIMREPLPAAQTQPDGPTAAPSGPELPGLRKPLHPRETTEWRRQGFHATEVDPELAERVRLQDLRAKRDLDNKMRLRGMMSIIRGASETDGPTSVASLIAVPPPAEAAKSAAKHVTFAENLATVKTFDGSGDAQNELPSTVALVSVTTSLTDPIVSTGLAASSTTVTLDGFPAIKPPTSTPPATLPSAEITAPATFGIATSNFNAATPTFSVATTASLTFPSPSTFGVAQTTSATLTFPSPLTFNAAKPSVTTSPVSSPSTFNIAKTMAAAIAFPTQSTFQVPKTSTIAFPAPSAFGVTTATTASELSKPAGGFGATTPFAFGASSTATTASSTFGTKTSEPIMFGAKSSEPISFGSKLTKTVTFGDKLTTPLAFGDKSSTSVTFGDKPAAAVTFGDKSLMPVTFGDKPAAAVTFGDKSLMPVTFGDKPTTLVTFGDKPITPVTFGQKSTPTVTFGEKSSTPTFGSGFGAAPPPYPTSTTQSTPTFGFSATSAVAPPPPYAPTSSAGFGFSQSATAGGFSFGSAKPGGPPFGGTGDNATFGHSKDVPIFGASKESPFGSQGKTEVSVFGAKTDPPAFGAKPEAAIFGSAKQNAFQFGGTTTTAGGFAFDTAKPAFGVATNGPTTTTSTFAFRTAAAKPFGFGENGSTFGAATAPAPAEGIFSFGQAPSKPAAGGGFAFGGSQQVQPSATAAGGFSFGSATSPTSTFGASPAPTFGVSSTTTPTFGAVSAPTFGSGPGFGVEVSGPPSARFGYFNEAAATPATGGFNFSAGAAPVGFGAPQQGNAFQTGGVAQFGAAPAPGMFSIGTGSSGSRGRQMRSRRR